MVVFMNVTWRPLESGEPIGVVALSGPVNREKLDTGLKVLKSWGHPIITASNLGLKDRYLAGTDEDRLAGLEEVLDSGVRWILAARGGYGCSRLMQSIPFAEMRRREVSVVGYSDLTAILNPLVGDSGASAIQVHGPMVASGLDRPSNEKRLRALLRGELVGRVLYRFPAGSVIKSGCVQGRSIGGNLSLITALLGTPWEPEFDGSVLFLEEVEEPLYRLDRMLTHLRASGRLRNVKALIGGSLRGCRPARDRAEQWRQLLLEAAPESAVVVADLPFGHGASNLAFPIGAVVEVDTVRRRISWR